jgi:hypothetical protein
MMLQYNPNPLSPSTMRYIGIGVTLAAGLLAIYLGLKSSSSSNSAVIQPGTQTITIPATGGFTLFLPPGGVWANGTSIPFVLTSTSFAAGTGTLQLGWTLNGKAQTTNLTITAVA